jgi:hypothetical protein
MSFKGTNVKVNKVSEYRYPVGPIGLRLLLLTVGEVRGKPPTAS